MNRITSPTKGGKGRTAQLDPASSEATCTGYSIATFADWQEESGSEKELLCAVSVGFKDGSVHVAVI